MRAVDGAAAPGGAPGKRPVPCRVRTCSTDFAQALAAQLGLGFTPCAEGIFTDTAHYAGLIPECTNLSIGYEHAHTGAEYQD